MRLAGVIAAILVCGIFGGFINALLTDNGFTFPATDQGVWRPGVFGNALIGAFAALIVWGTQTPAALQHDIAVQQLAAAAIAGAGGSRIVTAEVDKQTLTVAANTARARILQLEGRPTQPPVIRPFELRNDIIRITKP